MAGWLNYYGRYRPWEQYERLAAKRKAIAKVQEITGSLSPAPAAS